MPVLRPFAAIVGCLLIAQMVWCSTERSVAIPLFEEWLRSNNFFPSKLNPVFFPANKAPNARPCFFQELSLTMWQEG